MAGSSPAKGIFGGVWIVGGNRFPSTGQPWAKPGQDEPGADFLAYIELPR